MGPQAAKVAKLEEGPTKEAAKKKWSTGAKVAAGTAGVAVVGGLAVAGAVLGEHISEEGWDATIAELGDVATSAGDGIAEGHCTLQTLLRTQLRMLETS